MGTLDLKMHIEQPISHEQLQNDAIGHLAPNQLYTLCDDLAIQREVWSLLNVYIDEVLPKEVEIDLYEEAFIEEVKKHSTLIAYSKMTQQAQANVQLSISLQMAEHETIEDIQSTVSTLRALIKEQTTYTYRRKCIYKHNTHR